MSERPSVIFDEGTPVSPQMLAAALFQEEESDPRSRSYKRVLNRPKLQWGRIACAVLIPALASLLCGHALRRKPASVRYGIPLAGLFGWCFAMRSKIAVTAVRIYQRFAPASVRKKCRFEPSCSEYMILAIEKYGFFAGLRKGIDRLRRCGPGDGGYDAP